MTPLVETLTRHALLDRHQFTQKTQLRSVFQASPGHAERFSSEGTGLFLDSSMTRVTDETSHLPFDLAEAREVVRRHEAMFVGLSVHITEHRAVVHLALRSAAGSMPMAPMRYPFLIMH